ncbi:MAG: hypothetical protein ACFB02_08445 [Mastigocoleus sp.]
MKDFGFYGIDSQNALIQDIAESWGDRLQNSTVDERVQTLIAIASQLDRDPYSSPSVDEIEERIGELDENDMKGLISMIADSL